MPKRMLIDASHREETRVVVLDGNKVEEFDFEAATKRPLKGNIYLAKVTRVEPSLQAAFVEYGGNRQGFLAFSEIHPDYYQIPVADRQALLAEQEEDARRRADDEFEAVDTAPVSGGRSAADAEEEEQEEGSEENEAAEEAPSGESTEHDDAEVHVHEGAGHAEDTSDDHDDDQGDDHGEHHDSDESAQGEHEHHEQAHAEADSEPSFGESESALNGEAQPSTELAPAQPAQAFRAPRPRQRAQRRRHYKIQEVIKRRQIILVQVVKEERGNKGAALTTYLSLAGRYCVLMPNTPRGGGISRKITNAADRKRLKSAAAALELPEGMGLIIRTAGENRTKLEIKRDYEYLLRMWDTIRELTLKSNAPACVYEEGDLIKRAIRDLYNKDVAEVMVEGEDGYRNAKDFMRMLMPSHAKNVKQYKEPVPLFQRMHIEDQLDSMFSPTVTLKSGGYIVINQAEALVAIDVNSGRATREHNIEDTAYKTNLEAADEIGRQLRLRDLAGLIVIDFIDMEDGRNDRTVEKRLRDAVKNDRARVQIGKISQFGLLEMSRQRLRAGVIAGSTIPCPHCAGQGIVRSVESTALRVLRAVEEEGQRQRAAALRVRLPSDVAVYTLNHKRAEIGRIEGEYAIAIAFEPDERMNAGTFEIDRTIARAPEDRVLPSVTPQAVHSEPEPVEAEPESDLAEEIEAAEDGSEVRSAPPPSGEHGEQGPQGEGRRRRRRRRRGGRDREPLENRAGEAPRSADAPREPAPPREAPQAAPRPLPPQPAAPISPVQARFLPASFDDIDTTPGAYEAPRASHAPEPLDEAVAEPHHEGVGSEGPAPEGGEGGQRRRRRRRGRRGRRDGNGVGQPQLEGVPVDGSVQDHDGDESGDDLEPLPIAPIADVPVTPNLPSEPMWSLTAGNEGPQAAPASRPTVVAAPIREVEAAPVPKPEPAPKPAPAPEPVAAPVAAASSEPSRKGWWQRTFKQ